MSAKKLPIQPLGGNILVEPKGAETTTPSGLVIAASSSNTEKPQRGVVVALGTGKLDKDGKKIEWYVKVGDEVLFRKYSPDEVEDDEGTKYLIMKEEDVLAIIN